MKLLIASRNKGKIAEFVHLLPDFEIVSLLDFPELPDIVEDGNTFVANATKKARTLAEHTGNWAVADDSGLQVDALNGAPGVYSARYAGPDCDPNANIDKLLDAISDMPSKDRTARFCCAIALASPEGEVHTVEATCEGHILSERRGSGGFGYDPVFLSDDLGKTFAEATAGEKNRISHRGRAIQLILPRIQQLCQSK